VTATLPLPVSWLAAEAAVTDGFPAWAKVTVNAWLPSSAAVKV
jgi:hypothetical protein